MSAKNTTANKDLVVGLGKTGLSIARYLERNEADAIFFDSRSEPPGLAELQALFPDAEVRLGGDALPRGVTRIIASPGVADSHPLMKKALKKKVDIVSDIELFARDAERPFVAVTGSNGKSTVTTLLYHMCRAAGKNVLAGGNLGEPALDLLEEDAPDLYVLELSSFQLQRTANLPAEVALLLNISPDHLDWHTDLEHYAAELTSIIDLVEQMIREVESLYLHMLSQKEIKFTTQIPPGTEVVADRALMHMVVRNLLSNAIKFTPSGGEITLSGEQSDREFSLTISDNGPGIAPEEMGKIFEKFYQVDPNHTGQIRGFGLGLFYARQFVRDHGGEINLESSLGHGTSVTVRLPRPTLRQSD